MARSTQRANPLSSGISLPCLNSPRVIEEIKELQAGSDLIKLQRRKLRPGRRVTSHGPTGERQSQHKPQDSRLKAQLPPTASSLKLAPKILSGIGRERAQPGGRCKALCSILERHRVFSSL